MTDWKIIFYLLSGMILISLFCFHDVLLEILFKWHSWQQLSVVRSVYFSVFNPVVA